MAIGRLILASGESSPDQLYATGFMAPDEFIYFEAPGVRAAVLSPLEFDRGRRSLKPGVAAIRDSEFGVRSADGLIPAIAAAYKLDGFVVPAEFPFGAAEKLRKAGLSVTAVTGEFFPERLCKTADEIGKITASQRAAESGMRRAVEVIRESAVRNDDVLVWHDAVLTSEILRGEIDAQLLRCGMFPTGTICAGGVQSSQPHNAGSGALKAHDPIVIDIFPRSMTTGYWGDLTRTVCKGRALPVVKKAYAAVRAARERGKELIAVGANPAKIHAAADAVLQAAGFMTGHDDTGYYGFFHSLGHGVGLAIHEMPRLSPRCETPLRGGEVVTVDPGVYYPQWGGVRLEDLVWLSPDGACRLLTDIGDELEIE